jgi:hypothetical protein
MLGALSAQFGACVCLRDVSIRSRFAQHRSRELAELIAQVVDLALQANSQVGHLPGVAIELGLDALDLRAQLCAVHGDLFAYVHVHEYDNVAPDVRKRR